MTPARVAEEPNRLLILTTIGILIRSILGVPAFQADETQRRNSENVNMHLRRTWLRIIRVDLTPKSREGSLVYKFQLRKGLALLYACCHPGARVILPACNHT